MSVCVLTDGGPSSNRQVISTSFFPFLFLHLFICFCFSVLLLFVCVFFCVVVFCSCFRCFSCFLFCFVLFWLTSSSLLLIDYVNVPATSLSSNKFPRQPFVRYDLKKKKKLCSTVFDVFCRRAGDWAGGCSVATERNKTQNCAQTATSTSG